MFINIILDFIFPKRCLCCGKLGHYLCLKCNNNIKKIETNICPVCEYHSIDGKTHPKCQTKYAIDGLISFWKYEGLVKKIIHKIKYNPFVSDSIKEIIINSDFYNLNPDEKWIKNYSLSFKKYLKENPILIPIPLHKSRYRWRGFNHSVIIAKTLAKRWNLKVNEKILIRTKKTKPQAELKGEERKKNIQNAFKSIKVSDFKIQNSNFILVDDIWTTGSTLKTCATLLKRNGAKSVWGLTLAR